MAKVEMELQHLEDIREKNREVAKLYGDWKAAAEEAKEAKAEFDRAVIELRSMIDAGPDPQQKLEFEKAEAEHKKTEWRDFELSRAGIIGTVATLLNEGGIHTLGQLANHTLHTPLTAVTGIGPAKAEMVAKRMEQFWVDHPEYIEPDPPPSVSEIPQAPDHDDEDGVHEVPSELPEEIRLTEDIPDRDIGDGLFKGRAMRVVDWRSNCPVVRTSGETPEDVQLPAGTWEPIASDPPGVEDTGPPPDVDADATEADDGEDEGGEESAA